MNKLFEIVGVLLMLSFALRIFLFYYLEISNDYSRFPFHKFNAGYFTPYKKSVKQADEKWVKLSSLLLYLSGFLFCLCLIMILFGIDKNL